MFTEQHKLQTFDIISRIWKRKCICEKIHREKRYLPICVETKLALCFQKPCMDSVLIMNIFCLNSLFNCFIDNDRIV